MDDDMNSDIGAFFEAIMNKGDRLGMYTAELHEFYEAFIRGGFTEEQAMTFTALRFTSDIQQARENQDRG